MFNKNDPLVESVKKIMEQNERSREIEAKLCEELGIVSRKQLPREHLANYDALLEERLDESSKGMKRKFLQSVADVEKQSKAAGGLYWDNAHPAKSVGAEKKKHEKRVELAKKVFKRYKDQPEDVKEEELDEAGPTGKNFTVLGQYTDKDNNTATVSRTIRSAKDVEHAKQLANSKVDKGSFPEYRATRATLQKEKLKKDVKEKRKNKNKVTESLSIDDVMEEIARNLGEARLKEVFDSEDSNKPYKDQPLSQKEKDNAGTQAAAAQTPTSTPAPASTPAASPAQQGVGGSIRGALNRTVPVNSAVTVRSASERDDAESSRQAAANRPAEPKPAPASTPPSMQANRPSIRTGLNNAGLGTGRDGVVGGATPADRARTPTAAPATSSVAPANVAKQQSTNVAKNDDRDNAEVAAQAANRTTPAATPASDKPAPAAAPAGPAAQPKFGDAFKAARAAGKTEFDFNGKKFHTGQKGETKTQTQRVLSTNRMKSAPTPPPRPAGLRESLEDAVRRVTKKD
jgi:hypothetical protein